MTGKKRTIETRRNQATDAAIQDADECDHEWKVVDDSYEDQIIVYRRCEICDEESDYEDCEP